MTNPPVLLVGNFLSGHLPYRQVCEELAMRLTQRNWTVLTTSPHLAPLHRTADMLHTAWKRRNEYAVANVDVFSGRAFLCAEAVCAMLRRIRRPYILTLHGGNLPAFAQKFPKRVRYLLGTAAAVTTPSRFLSENLAAYSQSLTLLPNVVDISAYTFRQRRRLAPNLTWLRSFHSIYNPELAVQTMAALSHEFPDIHLTMIGPDKQEGTWQRVLQTAEELQVRDRLSMPGGIAKSEVPKWLSQADIFLNTTNIDNTPISVLEAMACGLCVVSTNVGGLPYLVEAGKDALLVPPNNVEAMTEAIRQLLKTPELAASLSTGARRKAEQHDWLVVLPQWEDLFRRIASSQPT